VVRVDVRHHRLGAVVEQPLHQRDRGFGRETLPLPRGTDRPRDLDDGLAVRITDRRLYCTDRGVVDVPADDPVEPQLVDRPRSAGPRGVPTAQFVQRRRLPAGELVQSGATIQSVTIVLTVLPILLVYPFVQRYFVSGVLLGAVKG